MGAADGVKPAYVFVQDAAGWVVRDALIPDDNLRF
jgi:hypothetical protein